MSARVLVVDDIEANVRLLQAKLEVEYYEVLTAPEGRTALKKAEAEQPDIDPSGRDDAGAWTVSRFAAVSRPTR